MIWTCLLVMSSAACSESAATAPDATSVVPPTVIVRLDAPVLEVGSRSIARAFAVNRAGTKSLRDPSVHWEVVSGSEFVGVDETGTLFALARGRAIIAATVDSVSGFIPVEVRGAIQARTTRPAPPAVFLDFPYPAVSGRSIRVDAGDNLQSALNSARRGDEIVIAGGATFVGNFILPEKAGTAADGWITVRGEHFSRLPVAGTRVSAADGLFMPSVVTPNTNAAIRTAPRASGWRLVGLEVTVDASVTQQQYGLVFLGDGSAAQNKLEDVPTDLVLDRMYIHGLLTTNMSRCVALNSARTQISDSYIDECHGKGFDSQAILGWNGPGPYKIVNNFLAGAGENIMFGGSDPSIPGLVPSDIEIRRNYIFTPLAWKGLWTKKNLLELKNAARVLIEANVLDGSWVDAQTGFAILLRSTNQGGGCRWCRSSDVTIRLNYITNVAGGINFIGGGGNSPTDSTARRLLVTETVFDGIGVSPFTGEQRAFLFVGGPEDVALERTVAVGNLNLLMWMDRSNPAKRVTFKDNVWSKGSGISVDGTTQGVPSLNLGTTGYSWSNMTLIGASSSTYPPGTTFVGSESQAPLAAQIRAAVRNATAGVAPTLASTRLRSRP